ncbi:MAG: MFS transporter [Thermoplasmata archaeon]|nr:MFS transporter [Thermoplasmata archaeon]
MSHRHGSLVLIQTLVALANTLANSFALIYLIREGHEYIECAIFILISALVPTVLIAFASRPIVSNFTASMATALMCLAGYYVALMFLSGWPLVLLPPLLFGTYIATFWVPYFALVMHITSSKKRAAGLGVYFLIWPLLTTVSPLLGGVIITYFSYQLLFAAGAAVALVGLVFIVGLKTLKDIRSRVIIPELIQSLKLNLVGKMSVDLDLKNVDWRLSSALFAEGVQDGIFWVAVPIISFEFARNEATLSGFLSLFALWGAIMTVALGYLSDRLKNRVAIVRLGAASGAVAVMIAASSTGVEEYLSAMSMAYLCIAMIPSFLFTMLVDKLEKYKKKGVLLRELFLNAGKSAGVALVIIALLLGLNLFSTFAIAAAALAYIIVVR